MQLVEVQVKQGQLRGQRLVAPNKDATQFDAFLGVPYAKPPLGDLRFKAPQPPEPWEGALPALDHKKDSLHKDAYFQKLTGSEDCLYLNVYSPQVPSSVRHPVEGAPWPVMVWFFPGGFTNGTSSMREFAPEYLVARGVVVVTVTYRLGPFGFLSLRSKTLPGNAGLKDGVAALAWVRENISAFGGDPTRVTVFGCSAGGAFCEYLQLAPAARGLFHRAISESGSVLNPWASVGPDDGEARNRTFRLARALGCDSQDDAEVLAFLQNAPATDILEKAFDSIDTEKEGSKGLLFAFLPVSEAGTEGSGEEAFLPDTPRNLLNSHRFFPVPWISGLTDCEGMITMFDDPSCRGINCSRQLPVFDNDLELAIPADLRLEKGSPASLAVAEGIRKLYFGGGKVDRNGYWDLFSDLLFTIGIVESVRLHASHPAAAPVFTFVFSVIGKNNRLSNFFKVEDAPGACHGDEMGYIWGARPPMPPEPEWEPHSLEDKTRRRMLAMWSNFARTGNPCPPSDPDVEGVEWLPVPQGLRGSVSPYLDIGAVLSTPRAPLWEERVAFWDDVYAKHFRK